MVRGHPAVAPPEDTRHLSRTPKGAISGFLHLFVASDVFEGDHLLSAIRAFVARYDSFDADDGHGPAPRQSGRALILAFL